MNTTTATVVFGILIAALAVLFVVTSARRDRKRVEAIVGTDVVETGATGKEVEQAVKNDLASQTTTTVAEWVPPTEEALGVTRRQFFNRSIVTLMSVALGGFGAACLAFLVPNKVTGFGGKVNAGKLDDILSTIATKKEPVYNSEGRFYLQSFPADALGKAKGVGSYAAVLPGMQAGVVALYQKCVHLGCKVPWCKSSQWFECPCHGSRYNRVGEKKGGPAPRGLDRFVVTVSGGNVVVDTGARILGPAVGTNTTGQEAEGPHC